MALSRCRARDRAATADAGCGRTSYDFVSVLVGRPPSIFSPERRSGCCLLAETGDSTLDCLAALSHVASFGEANRLRNIESSTHRSRSCRTSQCVGTSAFAPFAMYLPLLEPSLIDRLVPTPGRCGLRDKEIDAAWY